MKILTVSNASRCNSFRRRIRSRVFNIPSSARRLNRPGKESRMKCLILSDIHGNWPALQAVLDAERDADQILCLGDLVNYGPQPAECVAWAMNLNPPSRVIQGNHDRAFALKTAPCCAPANQRLAEAMQSATNHLLPPEMKRFLGALQPLQQFRCDEATCVACHSHTTAKNGERLDSHFGDQNAQWPWESDIVLLGHPDKLFVMVGHPDMLFRAHTHMPMKRHWGNTLAVNPGSVGLATDGDPVRRLRALAGWRGHATSGGV